jgi:hypothetical protein
MRLECNNVGPAKKQKNGPKTKIPPICGHSFLFLSLSAWSWSAMIKARSKEEKKEKKNPSPMPFQNLSKFKETLSVITQ